MSGQEAIDPVCGMTIPTQGALTREHEGETYHFCSESCASRFDADAAAYVAVSRLGLKGWGRTPPPGFLTARSRDEDTPSGA